MEITDGTSHKRTSGDGKHVEVTVTYLESEITRLKKENEECHTTIKSIMVTKEWSYKEIESLRKENERSKNDDKEHQLVLMKIIADLTAKLKISREALKELINSVTMTYEDQAKKHLKPKYIGKYRVWSDMGCWLYPGDSVCEVSEKDMQKAKQALKQIGE